MKKSCIARVHDRNSYRSYPCGRAAGHGPDGQYCAQHAQHYLGKMGLPVLKTIYKVGVNYQGEAKLYEGKVVKETKHYYYLDKDGGDEFSYSLRLEKGRVDTHFAPADALRAFQKECEESIVSLLDRADRAGRNCRWAQAVLNQMEKEGKEDG